jgi:hypothetical protein
MIVIMPTAISGSEFILVVVPRRRRFAISHHAVAVNVNNPILWHAVPSIERKLDVLIEGQRAIGYLDDKEHISCLRDSGAVIVLAVRAPLSHKS